MPYAEGRVFYDADSHLMETSDWLVSHADSRDVARVKLLADFIRAECSASGSFWAG